MQQSENILQKLNSIEALLLEKTSKPLNIQEAAAYLDISPSHLYKLTSKGRIAHSKPSGKRVYFDKSELSKWLLSNPVKTTSEIEDQAIDYVMKGGVK